MSRNDPTGDGCCPLTNEQCPRLDCDPRHGECVQSAKLVKTIQEKEGQRTMPLEPRRFLAMLTSAERKKYPITQGFLDYFPDAVTMVAHVSYLGNQKHNPGQPTHWSRGKSMDHDDCIARHLIQRGHIDPDKIMHSAELAWRAMAALQMEMEKTYCLDPPRGASDPT